jgi:hypothetical protein
MVVVSRKVKGEIETATIAILNPLIANGLR